MAPILGLDVILERGAAVHHRTVIEELELTSLEEEFEPDVGVCENVLKGTNRGQGRRVQRLTLQLVAILKLVQGKA